MSDVTAPNITPISIEAEMTSSFMDYAMSVIVSRALPDARDGLKPVHRRICSAARLNNTFNRPYLKMRPHRRRRDRQVPSPGDSAVYDALVRMPRTSRWALHADRRPGQLRLGSTADLRRPCATPSAG